MPPALSNLTAADRKNLAQLAEAGFKRPEDIVLIRPKHYENATFITRLSDTRYDQYFLAEVESQEQHIKRHGSRETLVCIATDQSASITLTMMYYNAGIRKFLQPGNRFRVLGRLHQSKNAHTLIPTRREMIQPRLRKVEQELPRHLTPVYPQIRQIMQPALARLIQRAIKHVLSKDATLDAARRAAGQTIGLARALQLLHHPLPDELAQVEQQAIPALKFAEWVAYLLMQRHRYLRLRRRETRPVASVDADIDIFAKKLPFKLTADQRTAMREIAADLRKSAAMRRLLHGDVGCGKTLVAAFGCWLTGRQGFRSVIMCPTVILAAQHYTRLKPLFTSFGIPCVLLISSQRTQERREALATLASNPHCVAIGTHTLFQSKTNLQNLTFAVIDEQHRFGVRQRKALERKGGAHVLMMSATPIPRTLELGMLSHLDITCMHERPNRSTTRTLTFSSDRANEVLDEIINKRLQAYWICPLISRSEKFNLRAAKDEFVRICQLAPQLNAQLIYGRLDNASKLSAMRNFESGATRLLVATTVVEVGVDAPEADVIVIDHAERLGLSQLHQLRGRVGRGNKTGFCALIYDPGLSEVAQRRLRTMHTINDGFKISKQDLLLRGPGDIIGKRQSGMPKYKFASLEDDPEFVAAAKQVALDMITNHLDDAQEHVRFWLGTGGTKQLQRAGVSTSLPPA